MQSKGAPDAETGPEPQRDATDPIAEQPTDDSALEEPMPTAVQTDQTHEDTPETETMQMTAIETSKDTPDKVQEKINRQLLDLYTKGMLKRPYAYIQQGEPEDTSMAKRIRAMMTTLSEGEPKTYEEGVNDPLNGHEWREAVQKEIKTLREFETWTEVPYQKGMKLVTTKFVFKIKASTDDQSRKLKARLVAQGFRQIRGIDFHETYAATPPLVLQPLESSLP